MTSHSRCIVEARRDGIDRICVPLLSDRPGVAPPVEVSDTTGCTLRSRHEFADSGMVLLDLQLEHRLLLGEITAFEYTLTPSEPGLDLFGDPRTPPADGSVLRLLHRMVDVCVVELTFAQPPRRLVEVESLVGDPERTVREVTLDGDHRARVVRRDARPGAYGFRWTW